MIEHILYGDGIHDDAPAIQAMLDAADAVAFPKPAVSYAIGRTLKLHAGQALTLTEDTEIRLLPNSNCSMLEDDDFSHWKENITVTGGIWNMQNTCQEPNPWHFPGGDGLTAYDRLAPAARRWPR